MAAKKRAKAAEIKDVELEAQVAEIVATDPPPAPDPPNAPPVRRYSLKETKDQIRQVESLMTSGARQTEIYRILRGEWPMITHSRIATLYARISVQWTELQKDDDRLAKREAALRRLHAMRRVAEGVRDTTDPRGLRYVVPPNHQAIARYEGLIMRLEGTDAPLKVDVDVRYSEAMLSVVAQLSGDQATELLTAAIEQERLADLARTNLPALVASNPVGGRRIERRGEKGTDHS